MLPHFSGPSCSVLKSASSMNSAMPFSTNLTFCNLMEEAIPELPLTDKEMQDFNDWLIKRRAFVESSDSFMQVFHLDVLIY